jgi:hypothetical protein
MRPELGCRSGYRGNCETCFKGNRDQTCWRMLHGTQWDIGDSGNYSLRDIEIGRELTTTYNRQGGMMCRVLKKTLLDPVSVKFLKDESGKWESHTSNDWMD